MLCGSTSMNGTFVLKPLRLFYAPEDMLFYIAEWCALYTGCASFDAWPSVFGHCFAVAVYSGVRRLYLDEVEDLDLLIKQCSATLLAERSAANLPHC